MKNENSSKTLKLLPIFLALLVIVSISGCTNQTPISTGPGVVITDFTPDFSKLNSGEDVRLQIKVQNQGQVKAENVKAEIAGINLNDWSPFSTSEKNLGSLLAYDADTKTPGQTKTVEWNLKAPKLAKGIEFDYTPIVKVSYDYKTIAQKPITIVNSDELRKIMQQGKTLPSKSTQSSAGPLRVEIKTGEYVKTEDKFGGKDIFPIYIKITNTEWEKGGTLVPGFRISSDKLYPVQVKITPPSGTNFLHSGWSQDDCSTGTITKDLWKGKDTEITCELEVTNPPEYREERLMTIELQYRFQIEAKTNIKVIGTDSGNRF